MASAAPARHAASAPRHHPYAAPPGPSGSASSSKDARKAQRAAHKEESLPSGSRLPPSPPRSRRDVSETPSIGLSMAFGSSGGSKWWDEELPAPPASLTSILDSFRKSGEGDRELLLSILGAKKAEEERLTALITTRLTVLQARLSLHSAAAAAIQSGMPSPMPPQHSALPPQHPHHLAVPSSGPAGAASSSCSSPRMGPSPVSPPPHHLPPFMASASMRPTRSNSPPAHPHHHHHHASHRVNLPALSLPGERTPSLTSRGSDASSPGAVSPASEHGRYVLDEQPPRGAKAAAGPNPDLERYRAAVGPAPAAQPTSFWRRSPENDDTVSLPPIRPRAVSAADKSKDAGAAAAAAERHGSLSPKSTEGRSFNGLEMLLDAGRRAVL